MSLRRLLVTEYNGAEVSLLIDEDGRTVSINAQTPEKKSLTGNIYAGNVRDVLPGLGGTFIDIGQGQIGFLRQDKRTSPVFLNRFRNGGSLRQGDLMLVQVKSDAVKTKDPVLTSEISLTGKYAVLLYPGSGVKLSSKITDEAERERLQKMTGALDQTDYGVIIRTASERTSEDLIIKDIKRLEAELEQIARSAKGSGKGILKESPDIIIDDVISKAGEYDEIITDSSDIYIRIRNFLGECYPEDAEKLRFYNIKEQMKTVYGVQSRMDEALKKKVLLRSGGALYIEPTEALVAIDVNSGKAMQPDFLKLNLEAAKECARQISLRNLSGIIIIDFISMKKREDNEQLISEMKKLLKDDPAKPVVHDMTELGLLEITRKKIRRPLYEIIDIC